ncbi:MAG: hypothetical protein JXA04_09890 [Gammaproteobacteria bacterium]|nr:hypothetical protein [Gammaproteobacteria bacterium]
MKTFLFFMLIIGAHISHAVPRSFTLNVDEWARPRSGERVQSFPSLRDFAVVWSAAPTGSVVEIRYPGGDEGSLWASELSDWLVALGIASEHIKLIPGHARADQIELLIIEPR